MGCELGCFLKTLKGENVYLAFFVADPDLTGCLDKSHTDAIKSDRNGAFDRKGVGINLDDFFSLRDDPKSVIIKCYS